MIGKGILGLSSLLFVGYGLACFYDPLIATSNAGLIMDGSSAFAEIGAMYGGLQIGFGIFCLIAIINSNYYRAGILALFIVIGCVGVTRLISQLIGGGDWTSYTIGALIYELATMVIAGYVFVRQKGDFSTQTN